MGETHQQPDEKGRNWREPVRSFRRWMADDDLLSGFQAEESSQPEIRTFFVSTITSALIAWDIAFDLGAFHTLFFARKHQLAVTVLVVILGVLVLRHQTHFHWELLGLLALPFLWLAFRLAFPVHDADDAIRMVDSGFFVVTILLYPVAFWILLRLMAPAYFETPNLRLKIASIVIVVVIATLGYLVGEFNNRFLTCEEFALSGNDLPADCTESRHPSGPPGPGLGFSGMSKASLQSKTDAQTAPDGDCRLHPHITAASSRGYCNTSVTFSDGVLRWELVY